MTIKSLNGVKHITAKIITFPKYLGFWVIIDISYICVLSAFLNTTIPLSFSRFFLVHLIAIIVGSLVMYTGVGAGVIWIPILTFLEIKPIEAVSLSIFTQIAGKGLGSMTYLLNKMVDLKTAAYFIPVAMIGAGVGYWSGFYISATYERLLLYIFVVIITYLLVKMVKSLGESEASLQNNGEKPGSSELVKSYPVVFFSSFATGLLSIGNSDWLIPHMEQKLKIPTRRSVATGLFIMFITTIFYLLLTIFSVWQGIRTWPAGTPLLFATCSGVIVGSQIGTRLTRYVWFRQHQKHAFILLLAMSIIHVLW